MGLQSVTRKASVLNQYEETLGDPLAYRTELEKVFAVTPEDVTRVARQYLTPQRIELDICPGRRRRDRPRSASTARSRRLWSIRRSSPITDAFDRSVMPKLARHPTMRLRGSSGARSRTDWSSGSSSGTSCRS